MDPVILAEVTRGSLVESVHRGSLVVADADARIVLELGEAERRIFPRSAVKAFQALPLIESGAADRFGLGPEALALACASHNGEAAHVAGVRDALARAGLDETCLECGAQLPTREADRARLARQGSRAEAVHNNCSGKHAGFLCLSAHMGVDPRGYVRPEHPAMREVTAALDAMTGGEVELASMAIDGCSIPSFAISLRAIAIGFARFGTGHGLGPERARAAARLRDAVATHPHLVAGTRRFDTAFIHAVGPRAFLKVGAEGVHVGALPEVGLGFALKIEDGATRASEVAAAAVVQRYLHLSDAEAAGVRPLAVQRLKNWNGIEVGEVRASTGLTKALRLA